MEPRIIGGDTVKSIKPWMAELEISRSGNPSQGSTLCGGTLVGPRWVLTAAHCVRDSSGRTQSASDLFVALGQLSRHGSPRERIGVRAVHVHESYQTGVYHNDLALLELSRASTQAPLDLAKSAEMEALADGETDEVLTAYGWGRTEDSSMSDHLQEADLDYATPDYCAKHWNNLIGQQLCAGELNPSSDQQQDTCRGDSGGPLVYQQEGKSWLVGVTSYGTQECATPGVPAVYTKVSAYLDWIERTSSGGMVDLQTSTEEQRLYASPGQAQPLRTRVSNLSRVNGADQVGVRVYHRAGLEIRGEDLDCRAGDGYTDCRGSLSLATGTSSGEHRLWLHPTHGHTFSDPLRLVPISDSHDYHTSASEELTPVFSEVPDIRVTTETVRDGGVVRLRAEVENRATHRDARDVWVSFDVPNGWDWDSLPEGCVSGYPVRCDLGDLPGGESQARSLALKGEGSGRVVVDAGTANGDFPSGDTRTLVTPANAGSETPRASDGGSGGSGGGGGGGALGGMVLLGGMLLLGRRRNRR